MIGGDAHGDPYALLHDHYWIEVAGAPEWIAATGFAPNTDYRLCFACGRTEELTKEAR